MIHTYLNTRSYRGRQHTPQSSPIKVQATTPLLTQRPKKAHTPPPPNPINHHNNCQVVQFVGREHTAVPVAAVPVAVAPCTQRSGGRPRWHAATANSMRCTTVRGGTHSGGKRSAPAPKRLTYAHREPSEEEDNLQLSVYGHSGAVVSGLPGSACVSLSACVSQPDLPFSVFLLEIHRRLKRHRTPRA